MLLSLVHTHHIMIFQPASGHIQTEQLRIRGKELKCPSTSSATYIVGVQTQVELSQIQHPQQYAQHDQCILATL